MTSTITDRRSGVSSAGPVVDRITAAQSRVALKAPVRVATTAAITLSGLQTIDGVALAAGDRVLVKDQASAVYNSIRVASTGDWPLAPDWDDAGDVVRGTQVFVTDGATSGGRWYSADAVNPVVIGTTEITFSLNTPPTGDGTALQVTKYTWTAIAAQTVFNGADASPPLTALPDGGDAHTFVTLGRLILTLTTDYTRAGVNYTLVGDTAEAGEKFIVTVFQGGSQGEQGEPGEQGPPGNDGADGTDGIMASVVPGNNIDVDATDPANPIVKVEDGAAVSVFGRSANSSGVHADIAAGANDRILARVADALSFAQLTVGMITDGIITFAKMASAAIATAAELRAGTASKLVSADIALSASAWVTLTDAATVAVDHAAGVNRKITLGGNRAFGAPTNTKEGWPLNIWIVQDGTGTRVPTWDAVYDFGDAGTPTLSTGASQADLVTFICLSSTKYAFLGIRKRVD